MRHVDWNSRYDAIARVLSDDWQPASAISEHIPDLSLTVTRLTLGRMRGRNLVKLSRGRGGHLVYRRASSDD